MPDIHDPASQTIVNWAGGVIAGLLAVIYAIGAWVFLSYAKKVDDLKVSTDEFVADDKLRETYATRQDMNSLEVRMADMVSRKELMAHMDHLAAESKRNADAMAADRLRMHEENLVRLGNVAEDVRDSRADIRGVHQRIDDALRSK